MNILVCIKQVPDTSDVKIDSKTNNLVREGVPSIINPYDEVGMELALRLRERHGGKVTAVSMGPTQAKSALVHCLEMGADDAVLLSDRAVGGSDTLATGYALSRLIKTYEYDLIVCGSEAIDGCTGQVGPIIADNLGIPQFTYVSDVAVDGGKLTVKRGAGRYVDTYEVTLPALICVIKGAVDKIRKRSETAKEPHIVTATDLRLDIARTGLDGSPTRVVKIVMSDARAKSYVMIDDSLSAGERIEMIINGGIEKKEKINLLRGTTDKLAGAIMKIPALSKFLG